MMMVLVLVWVRGQVDRVCGGDCGVSVWVHEPGKIPKMHTHAHIYIYL